MQKSITESLSNSAAKVNEIIKQDFQIKKDKKQNIYHLLSRHMAQPKTFCSSLYENYLVGNKGKYRVILDEARVRMKHGLNVYNRKRFIYY